MADKSEEEINSPQSVHEMESSLLTKIFFGSGDEDTEPKKDDDSEATEEKEVPGVEQKVESAIPEPRAPTLEGLANSDFIRNRQLAAKSIVEYLHQAGSNKEALHSVISIMCKLTEDEEIMVRSELMEHIPSIALFCKEHSDDLGVVIRQQIVPYTVKLLTDIQIQVRKIGHTTLLVLLENNIIDDSQLSEWICPLIAQLATSENTPQELRLEDVSVMCKMIPYVGKEITEKFFLEPFLSLCHDSASSAREVCMLNFGSVCKVVGRETTESTLLSAFLDLCHDESCQIKSKCIDIAVDLASVVSSTTRNEILSHVYVSFLKNDSRSVYFAAYMSLGKFISTFADPSKTGLSYSNGMWIDTPVEEENTNQHGDDDDEEDYFELLTSHLISNPQLLDECSFKNLNHCLFHDYSSDDELNRTFSSSEINYSELENKVFGRTTNSNMYWFERSMLKQTRTYSNSDTAYSEKINDENSNINSEINSVEKTLSCEKPSLTNSPVTLAAKDGHLYLHVDNDNLFNNFQFWRTPLPEVELDIDIEECKSANINVRAKLRNEDGDLPCTSQFSVRWVSPKQSSKDPSDTVAHTNSDAELIQDKEAVARDYIEKESESSCFSESQRKNRLLLLKEKIRNQKIKKEQKPLTEKEKQAIIYDQDIVPPVLLMEFINDIPYREDERANFAYHFPSVAYTLGRKYWPCIRDLFNMLATDIEFKVKKTIAASLHELAVILGQDITTEDLFPVFSDMLRVSTLRSLVLMNMSSFLKNLKPHARKQFLPLIEGICRWEDDESNWRYRLSIAEQFIPCIELFSSYEALHFLPASLLLLQDKVSAVRKSAVELLAVIVRSIATNSKSSDFIKAALCALDEKYRKSNKWLWRQMYVYICEELAVKRSLSTEFYVDEVIPSLFSLAWDTVPNVRLAVARCLGFTLVPLDFLPSIQKKDYQGLLQVMYSLQSDVDKDVRHFAHFSATAFNVLPPNKQSAVVSLKKWKSDITRRCDEWWEKSD